MSPNGPEFKNAEQAAYELPWLLRRLGQGSASTLTPEQQLLAQAAEGHAYNASDDVLSGIEAIGSLLFIAGNNDQWPLNSSQLCNIGTLLRHLAVEAQFLKETEAEMRYLSKERPAPDTERKGGHRER
jgi:hypothetical protein